MDPREQLANWWAAKPWRVYPWADDGWRYRTLYRRLRRGSRHPMDPFGHTYLSGGEPRGRLAALWGAIAFPHVHDEDEGTIVEIKDHPPDPGAEARQLAAYRHAFKPDWTVRPGETLEDALIERDMNYEQLAAQMGRSVSEVLHVLTGESRITQTFAIDLERVLGITAEFWLRLEALYRADLARLWPGLTWDLATNPRIANLAAENGIDVTRCEFCDDPLDAAHPWRRGQDGACAHEVCLTDDGSRA